MQKSVNPQPYVRLLIMIFFSFVAMYLLMYAMVDTFSNVFPNINQFYMAGLMTIPMIIIELSLMGEMYDQKWNGLIIIASVILMIGLFASIREQTAIGDEEFLKSMIPHHGSAILMCEKAPIQDLEVKDLCAQIIEGQQSEINQMKTILDRLKK